MTEPHELRERLAEVIEQAESQNPFDTTVALERLDRAFEVVIDELERCVPGTDEPMVIEQRRVCRDLAQALGLEVGR